MQKYSPAERKLLNDLSNKAYDIELGQHLDSLLKQFQNWKAGEIDADQVHEEIHEYYKGPGREVYKKYNHSTPDVLVAQAIVFNILSEDEIPETLLKSIAPLISEFKNLV